MARRTMRKGKRASTKRAKVSRKSTRVKRSKSKYLSKLMA